MDHLPDLVGASLLAMDSRTPRLASKSALSLTTIASRLAPTEDHVLLNLRRAELPLVLKAQGQQ